MTEIGLFSTNLSNTAPSIGGLLQDKIEESPSYTISSHLYTTGQSAKTAVMLIAPKPQLAQLTPLALERDVCAGFDPDDEGDAQLAEQGKQGHISKPPIRRDDDAVLPNGLGNTAHSTTDDRQFVALHAPF